MNGKYSQKFLDHAKTSTKNALKTTSKRVIRKTADAAGDLIGNKIADRNTKVSKILQQNNSESVTNEHSKEIPKRRYISPEERQKIIDDLKFINTIKMEYQKAINMLGNAPNQPSKFRTKKWVEITDEARRPNNKYRQINIRLLMLKSSLFD